MTTAELYEAIEALEVNDSFTIERADMLRLKLDDARIRGILKLFDKRTLTFFSTHDGHLIIRRAR